MRYNILLLVLMFGLCYSVLGQDSSSSSDNSGSSGSSSSSDDADDLGSSEDSSADGSDDQNDDDSSDGEGNENDNADENSSSEDEYSYICDNPEDKACVRDFFRRTFLCIRAPFDDRQPVYRRRQISYVPSVNLTLITTRDVITFSGSKIENLYFNQRTSNLVMTVSFDSIRIESGFTYYVIHQRGQEPVIGGDSVNVTYTPTLTAIIPYAYNKIDLKRASVHAYHYDANPKYEVGSALADSSNPVVAKTVDALLSNLPTAIQEVFLTEAKSFFLAYFQSQICYSGAPLYTQI